jgi:hypothetical protein
VILDGKLYDCDRVAESVTSVKGKAIDAWYSGKHRDFGANIQAVIRPDGLPIWTSHASPGHLHDFTCAQQQGVTAALNWAAAELELPALADAGYDGAGHGIKTPTRQPADGKPLAVANRAVNRLLRGLRWQGERGFAILNGRWRTLRHTTVSPRRIGEHRRRSPAPHALRIPIPDRRSLRSTQLPVTCPVQIGHLFHPCLPVRGGTDRWAGNRSTVHVPKRILWVARQHLTKIRSGVLGE